MTTALAATWDELAAQLGTTRKSILSWRKQFPADCPRRRDVAAWDKFMRENCLGPYGPRNFYEGPASAAPPAPIAAPPSRDPGGMAILKADWNARRSVLFEIMEFIHAAYADGALNLSEYREIGTETFIKLCELDTLWNAGIDQRGWMKTWQDNLADAMRAQDAENQRQANSTHVLNLTEN